MRLECDSREKDVESDAQCQKIIQAVLPDSNAFPKLGHLELEIRAEGLYDPEAKDFRTKQTTIYPVYQRAQPPLPRSYHLGDFTRTGARRTHFTKAKFTGPCELLADGFWLVLGDLWSDLHTTRFRGVSERRNC